MRSFVSGSRFFFPLCPARHVSLSSSTGAEQQQQQQNQSQNQNQQKRHEGKEEGEGKEDRKGGEGGKGPNGFFSFLRHGPRSRAEFAGLCLGCAVFPVSVGLANWLEARRAEQQPPQLGLEFGSMRSVTPVPKQQLGGPFRLRESKTGAYITDKEIFGDHWTLLYFGFSKCAEICPTTLRFLADALKKCDATMTDSSAKEAAKLQIVFLSVDSFRDSPEVLEAFVSKFDTRVRALSGTADEVQVAAKAWRVYYSSVEETAEEREAREAKGIPEIVLDESYQFDHSSAIYLVGPDGKMKDFFFKEMGMDDLITRLGVHFEDIYGFKDTR